MKLCVRSKSVFLAALIVLMSPLLTQGLRADELSDAEMKAVLDLEQRRIDAIDRVLGSVVAVYGNDRAGGGSGVIIHPSGIVLTNHHVVMGAGVEGFGGISDGKLYKWKLIGTDPGGDVSMIQLEGRDDFPCTPLGDSDKVRVGDWALAMGNPFILSEDQAPTVTLGIVSGIQRYQPGAGQNQLEYGNCIQVDSSINPGNSGGPLFNFNGEVVGINGRGSFQDRGRVNVGLGYAISSNQIRNFIPELLATKLVEHATLDANFGRREDKVVCSQLNLDSAIAEAGVELGDELLEFEGHRIKTANQFTNLICTIPEDWPVSLKVRSAEGKEKSIRVRAFGLPYAKPRGGGSRGGGKKTPEQKKAEEKRNAMIKLLSATPGTIRLPEVNQKYASLVLQDWRSNQVDGDVESGGWKLSAKITRDGDDIGDTDETGIGEEQLQIFHDGRFHLQLELEGSKQEFLFDGKTFFAKKNDEFTPLPISDARTKLWLMSAYGIAAALGENSMSAFGVPLIDGSDKTQSKNAWRLRMDDSRKDSTFVWFDFNRQYGQHELAGKLRKISPSHNCDAPGGVLFEDYQVKEHLAVPMVRKFVNGLDENVSYRTTLVDCQFDPKADDAVFAKLPSTDSKEPAEADEETDVTEETETTEEPAEAKEAKEAKAEEKE